ncbi:helicase C-terminal domain-containing protein [Leptolyngbya sp. KIOST-1]|uniref:helicase C-terminal domain-containing protein n=1 Tax=Leptolyngbya sp. KIOST-1 TaxID=1229172 RepID=UPI0005606109|nr:helicase C-terminal domain-containing protein [Leptolyngbya sp. KIOST-1]
MIEAQVHQQLRALLREWGEPSWPHHLTLARLVARALRLGRSALLQVGGLSAYQGEYRLSYLIALMMWPGPAIVVAPEATAQRLLVADLPRLQEKLRLHKPVHRGDRWPGDGFNGLLITTPEAWLGDRLNREGQFPDGIPTLIDDADHLEQWVQQQLTVDLGPLDWNQLALAYPNHQRLIQDTHVALTHTAFQRPANPYQRYLLDEQDCQQLQRLHQVLTASRMASTEGPMPAPWERFWQQFNPPDHLLWFTVDRDRGRMGLHCAPVNLALPLESLWSRQPVVLIGAALDPEPGADNFRQRLGLGDLTCLQFTPNRQHDAIQLYLPTHLPLPNTPQFQGVLHQEVRRLLSRRVGPDPHLEAEPDDGSVQPSFTVILLDDLPLRGQLGATLAGEFGSRVQVEQTAIAHHGILVSGWGFWQRHRALLPPPTLLIVATLPLPSLENPMVAARVAFHKRRRQDWFRLYLFPTAVTELQRAIAPSRQHQGTVALLDTRVHYRSYGGQILEALSPAACTRSLPLDWG